MNNFLAKIKTAGERPLNQKLFFILFTIIPVFYLMERLVCSVYDSDMYFLIATGREILENGIPHTNVWTIDSSSGIIVQQWLYDVILAFVDKAGYAGFSLFICLEFCIFTALWMYFFSMRKVPKILSFFLLILISMPAQDYLFSIRPQIITMILVLGSCIALEKFAWTKKYRWLILLPVLSCLEMQVHASMWFLHFAVILAYMIPAFYFKPFGGHLADDFMLRFWKPVGITCIAMAGSLFLNPYGSDGVLYLIKSFKAHTFSYVSIMEVNATEFISPQGATVILCIVLLVCAWKSGSLASTTVNMTAGFLLMMMMAIRNNTCCIFVMAFIMRDLAQFIYAKSDMIDWKKDLKLRIVPVLLFADLIFVTNFTTSCANVFAGTDGSETNLPEISAEIRKNYNEDMHIFTGFNCGAYFEYDGFKNLYIDARPEIYTSEFTGDKNILRDYSKYCVYGYDVSGMQSSLMSGAVVKMGIPVLQDEMDAWLTEYDFDYLVISPMSEPFLSAYLLNCNSDVFDTGISYEIVPDVSNSYYALYRKVGLE